MEELLTRPENIAANVVLNPDNPLEIIGILDWKMATLGDPLMELDSSLAYWINKDDPPNPQMTRGMLTTAEGMMTRNELVQLYIEKYSRAIETGPI